MATVARTRHTLATSRGLTTLEQEFRFADADAAGISAVLRTSPLVGSASIFGDRPGVEGPRTDTTRELLGFSPAPGFRFDVAMTERDEGVLLLRFSQPDRSVPYLQGDFLWTVTDTRGGAVLAEDINTDRALEIGEAPLDGPKPSLRRWLFFRLGHGQVMRRATHNIAELVGRSES